MKHIWSLLMELRQRRLERIARDQLRAQLVAVRIGRKTLLVAVVAIAVSVVVWLWPGNRQVSANRANTDLAVTKQLLLGQAPVVVNSEPAWLGGERRWVLPGHSVPDLPDADFCGDEEALRWLEANGAIWANGLRIRVTAVSTAATTAVLEQIEVQSTRFPGAEGTNMETCFVGDSGDPVPLVEVDLDKTPLTPMLWNPDADEPIDRFVFDLASGEALTFDMYVFADSGLHEWRVVLHWVIDGVRHRITIDNNGEPFRITELVPGPVLELPWK